jgi:hypothetical protein
MAGQKIDEGSRTRRLIALLGVDEEIGRAAKENHMPLSLRSAASS